jgi:hypothetical protein
VVELDERIVGPELLPELVARHHLAGARQERHQNLNGLPAQPHARPALAQLARPHVELEHAERKSRARLPHVHVPHTTPCHPSNQTKTGQTVSVSDGNQTRCIVMEAQSHESHASDFREDLMRMRRRAISMCVGLSVWSAYGGGTRACNC